MKTIICVLCTVFFCSAQTYWNDSVAVKAILNANAPIAGLSVASVTQTTGGRISHLNLSSQSLMSLTFPAGAQNLSALEKIDLTNNLLTSFPTGLTSLTWVDTLFLSNNLLTVLPTEISAMNGLKCLRISDNQINTIPPAISGLTSLAELYADNNGITALPAELWSLTTLQTLVFSLNPITSIDANIGNLTQLRKFALTDASITTVPPNIGNCAQLKELSLDNNDITSLPIDIQNLTALTSLSISNNMLDTLPFHMLGMTALASFYCNNNNLRSLPPGIGSTAITRFNINGNRIYTLLDEITNLSPILLCDAGNNHLCCISSAARTWLDGYDYGWESTQDTTNCPACVAIEKGTCKISGPMLAAQPNPFNTAVSISVLAGGHAELAVYDLRGDKIGTLFSGLVETGKTRSFTWDARHAAAGGLPAGLYLIQLKTAQKTLTAKVLYAK